MKGMPFKSEMVRAILAGNKTQTRRIHADMEKPRYKVGDIVYVAETYCHWKNCAIIFKADYPDKIYIDGLETKLKWKSNRFMPYKYARIKLKIINARKQMICNITEGEAKSEGFSANAYFTCAWDAFFTYFYKINPDIKGNTEVWAYTFDVVEVKK